MTEATLHRSVVTLTLAGRQFNDRRDIERALTISGIDGVTLQSWDADRVSDTVATVELTVNGDFDTDATLTFTVGAGAIAGYNQGFTLQRPVTAVEESLAASTESPLTEANLHGSVVTRSHPAGRQFNDRLQLHRRTCYNEYQELTVSLMKRGMWTVRQ